MVTLKDVAAEAGVHTATASRALNSDTRHLVNPQTAAHVMKVAKKLGYRPNVTARSLKTRRSLTVGVLIPDLTNPLFPPIMRGIEDMLDECGYTALIANTDNNEESESRRYDAFARRGVDGFIFATARRQDPLIDKVLASGVPLVLANRRTDRADLSSVINDDESGTAQVVRHLVELGHRRIAYVAGPQNLSTGHTRLRAFREALAAEELPVDTENVVVAEAFTEQAGERAAREILDRNAQFTAIVAANDLIAIGCYDAFGLCGIRCPADISVVGYNDMPFIDKLSPSLTSVHLPHYEIGVEAARLLMEKLREPSSAPKALLLQPELVVRASTAAPSRAT